ncbi:MAG: hypothetical protein IPH88_19830 [Bacteroidales bacterium]|nr:hypothetical protein [Bacteroidales bacterium]
MSSIIACTNNNKQLKEADPMTVVSAAAMAATLDLPINPALGFAHRPLQEREGRNDES